MEPTLIISYRTVIYEFRIVKKTSEEILQNIKERNVGHAINSEFMILKIPMENS